MPPQIGAAHFEIGVPALICVISLFSSWIFGGNSPTKAQCYLADPRWKWPGCTKADVAAWNEDASKSCTVHVDEDDCKGCFWTGNVGGTCFQYSSRDEACGCEEEPAAEEELCDAECWDDDKCSSMGDDCCACDISIGQFDCGWVEAATCRGGFIPRRMPGSDGGVHKRTFSAECAYSCFDPTVPSCSTCDTGRLSCDAARPCSGTATSTRRRNKCAPRDKCAPLAETVRAHHGAPPLGYCNEVTGKCCHRVAHVEPPCAEKCGLGFTMPGVEEDEDFSALFWSYLLSVLASAAGTVLALRQRRANRDLGADDKLGKSYRLYMFHLCAYFVVQLAMNTTIMWGFVDIRCRHHNFVLIGPDAGCFHETENDAVAGPLARWFKGMYLATAVLGGILTNAQLELALLYRARMMGATGSIYVCLRWFILLQVALFTLLLVFTVLAIGDAFAAWNPLRDQREPWMCERPEFGFVRKPKPYVEGPNINAEAILASFGVVGGLHMVVSILLLFLFARGVLLGGGDGDPEERAEKRRIVRRVSVCAVVSIISTFLCYFNLALILEGGGEQPGWFVHYLVGFALDSAINDVRDGCLPRLSCVAASRALRLACSAAACRFQ